jgi:arylsulfatase A-like enzyme
MDKISRRSFLASAAAPLAVAQTRPNIVLFLADDLGWNDVGFHGGEIRTPNIDGIAKRGVRFTHLYSYPFCSPTRAALMTGRSPVRYGMIYSVIRPWSAYGVPLDEPMMPEIFHSLGFQTAMLGKWHLGHAHQSMLPHRRGFDHFYGFVNADIDCYSHTHIGALDWQRNGAGVREEGYSTDLLAAEAERLIRSRNRNKPLFLYMPFNAAHTPLQAPQALIDKYGHIGNQRRRVYAAMTEAMDTAIGRVLAAIDANGMTDDTLVLFLSDNGGPPGAGGSNAPLRAGKGTVFEGGIRVAAAAQWPGRLKPDTEVRQVMTVCDLLPTLAAAAGATPATKKPLDGISAWPQMTGAAPVPRDSLFWAVKRNETADFQFAFRRREWKLVRQVSNDKLAAPDMLFNLEQDPEEKTDLAAANPDFVKSLGAELDKWRALHPKAEINSSMTPHPGWIPPRDFAEAAASYE